MTPRPPGAATAQPDSARGTPGRAGGAGAAADARNAGHGIGRRLVSIVIAIALPMALLIGAISWRLAEHQRDASRQAIVYSSKSVSSAVDAQIGRYVAAAQALAASPSLDSRDFQSFRAQAGRALQSLPGAWILIATPDGQQVLNTRVPDGQPLPPVIAPVRADQARAFKTRAFQVSNVGSAPLAGGRPAIGVGVPIFAGEQPAFFLMIVVDVAAFRDLLNSQGLPDGWVAGVIDRDGNFVARSRDHDRAAGTPASAGWRAAMRHDGVFHYVSRDGRDLVSANTVSAVSGWATAVAIEKSTLERPVRDSIAFAGLASLAVTGLSVLFATWLARRIVGPIATLEQAAIALRQHTPVQHSPTGVPEVDRVLKAFEEASRSLIEQDRALKAREQQLRLLLDGTIDYAVFMIDPDGRVLTWNEGARRIKGYDAADVVGRHFSMFYASGDLAANELQLALRAGVVEKECEHIRKDGTRFLANVVTTPLFDEKGALKGYSRIARDVTNRKDEEQRLRAQAALLDLSRDAIIFRSPTDRITFWSRGAEQVYGWAADQVMGQVTHELLKTRFPRPLPDIQFELKKSGQWDGELVHTRKDGHEIVVASRWVLQRDGRGEAVGILEVNRYRT